MKITVTYDADLCKVVPIEATSKMTAYATTGVDWRITEQAYKAMLAAVPADQPGVVEHSGEPIGYIAEATLISLGVNRERQCNAALPITPNPTRTIDVVPVFAHPPAQPDTEALQKRIAELEQLSQTLLNVRGVLWLDVDIRDKRIAELEAQLAAQAGQEPSTWLAGAPPHPWNQEWFIAITTYGDRVVLRSLPEDFSYDFKTADGTYIKADKIKGWMQFPDSKYTAPPTASHVEIKVLRDALEKLARLGNGDCYGNSIGNDIAIAALQAALPVPANSIDIVQFLLDWVDSRIEAEVTGRPDVNIYKRTLLETWTQMRRKLLELKGDGSAAPPTQVSQVEAAKLALILRDMCEGGTVEPGVDIYAPDYQAADGDVFVIRAAELLELITTPANHLAIVQAVLEAAVTAVQERTDSDEIFVPNAVDAIRSIDQQSVLDDIGIHIKRK